MKSVVAADTSYWIALLNRDDQWCGLAQSARTKLRVPVHIVTTDEVLTELLAFFSRAGSTIRKRAVETVRMLQRDRNVEVIPQTRESFNRALKRYEERADTGYSLTDCALMLAMEERAIREVLSGDHHFEQEGFIILMKEA